MKIVKVLALILAFVVIIVLSGILYINLALPDTGPAPDVKAVATPERLLRGKYLANHVAACMDCHSVRDWNQYAGPMINGTLGAGGETFDENMGFPGKIYASNITPHNLSSWTDGEILKAITTGESKDGRALFPLMAYSRFGKMDQEDLLSIIAYLRSLEPINKSIPKTKLDFPVNLIIKTLPSKADFQKIPLASDSVKYGAYLVNAAGCVDCHSKNEKGNIVKGSEFGGGMEFKFPSGTLRSPNITMHKTNGLGTWTKEAFVKRFKVYADSNYKSEKVGMTVNNTTMPWTMYAGMKTEDLEAMYVYLKSLKPNPNKVVTRTVNP